MRPSHTIIVGAGIVGCCTAYELARRGHRVTLLDRGEVAHEASFGNAGIIAVGHPPLPRPGLVGQTLKWMFDPASPLYIPMRPDPTLLRWLWDFRRACSSEQFHHSMRVLSALGRDTIECFERIIGDESLDCDYHRTGWMEIFRTESRRDAGRGEAHLLAEYGYEVVELDGATLRERDPSFNDDVVGALHYTDSAFADPYRFTSGVAAAAARHGATVREHVEVARLLTDDESVVRGVETSAGESIEADCVVLATGIWTTALARAAGLHIPMQAAKGYHLNIPRPDPCPSTVCVLAERYVACTPLHDRLRLAGTLEFTGINDDLRPHRLEALVDGARLYFRDLADTTALSTWSGLRPCTADGLPVVGWAPHHRGVFVATGHAMMGFCLGPITGRLVCETLLDGTPSIDLGPLSVGRFRQPQPTTRTPALSR